MMLLRKIFNIIRPVIANKLKADLGIEQQQPRIICIVAKNDQLRTKSVGLSKNIYGEL